MHKVGVLQGTKVETVLHYKLVQGSSTHRKRLGQEKHYQYSKSPFERHLQ